MIELKMGQKVKIKRGKLKGQIFTVHQSANDWLMVEELPAKILSISSVEVVSDKENNGEVKEKESYGHSGSSV